jgi:hypothetical protein
MEEMRCETVRKLLKKYHQTLLKPPQKGQVERHLFYCSDCVHHLTLQKILGEKSQNAFIS